MLNVSMLSDFWNWASSHSVGVKWTDVATAIIASLGVIGGLTSYNRRTKQDRMQDRLNNYKYFMEQNQEFENNRGIQTVRAANTATLDLRGRPFKIGEDGDAPLHVDKKVAFHGIMIFEQSVPIQFEHDLQMLWAKVTFSDKYNFMTFYERIQLLVQSRLMSKELAFYLFGVEYLSIFRTQEFWNNFERPDDIWWGLNLSLFKSFEKIESKYKSNGYPVKRLHF